MNIIQELHQRNLTHQVTHDKELQEHVNSNSSIGIFAGFDPTGPSLHAGHLLPLMTLKRFAQCGHRAIALIGSATASIGDPREVGERIMQSQEVIDKNAAQIEQQIRRIAPEVQIINNNEWTNNLTAIELLRDIGKHFSINTMISRETVKNRLNNDGMSFTEFSYLLLQANDFSELLQRENITLQLGGSDQWSNIVAGINLIKKTRSRESFGITLPLITNSDGSKFGKSTNGSIWLDEHLTTPFTFHQWLLNTHDNDVRKLLLWFTFLSVNEINNIMIDTLIDKGNRLAQNILADNLAKELFGETKLNQIKQVNEILFNNAVINTDHNDIITMISEEIGSSLCSNNDLLVDIIVKAGLENSKNAARRLLKQKGLSCNNTIITENVKMSDLMINHKHVLLRKGKKRFHLITMSD